MVSRAGRRGRVARWRGSGVLCAHSAPEAEWGPGAEHGALGLRGSQ